MVLPLVLSSCSTWWRNGCIVSPLRVLALVRSLSQSCDKMQVSLWFAYSLSVPAEILYTGPSVSDLSIWELRQPTRSYATVELSRQFAAFSAALGVLCV